ncbi:hypothetical protein CEXT_764421 [Caerostris extrusa]|uniref:Uncharacterized protein n=1 Tax=Caerostris extrusa TaxID=172846 RepID=A0AAV4MK27_CAEEX|nr:hypothetical protein CEXT_764421 [Caerostris extrusa]
MGVEDVTVNPPSPFPLPKGISFPGAGLMSSSNQGGGENGREVLSSLYLDDSKEGGGKREIEVSCIYFSPQVPRRSTMPVLVNKDDEGYEWRGSGYCGRLFLIPLFLPVLVNKNDEDHDWRGSGYWVRFLPPKNMVD